MAAYFSLLTSSEFLQPVAMIIREGFISLFKTPLETINILCQSEIQPSVNYKGYNPKFAPAHLSQPLDLTRLTFLVDLILLVALF